MIDDQELAGLFREESEEHLQKLDEGLLHLEKNPHDGEVLQEVFRSAHSLKGAARMLEVFEVETLAHQFEDVLGSAAKGLATLSVGTIERLYGALDALRSLVKQAVTGAPAGVDLNAVLRRLNGEAEIEPAYEPPFELPEEKVSDTGSFGTIASQERQEVRPDNSAHFDSQAEIQERKAREAKIHEDQLRDAKIIAFHTLETPAPPPSPAPIVRAPEPAPALQVATPAPLSTSDTNWKIETIRVEPAKLDALLAMAGELIVATTRARRGRGEFEALVALWEDETKSVSARRRVLSDLERLMERHIADEASTLDLAPPVREMRRLLEREEERLAALGALLARLRAAYDDVARLDGVAGEMEEAIRGVRLLPLSTLFALFPRLVRDLAKSQEKAVAFVIEGGETTADKRILEELKDPLMHMVRNAVDHGIESPFERERAGKPVEARLTLRAVQSSTQVLVELRDDGRGLDEDAIARAALRKGLLNATEIAALNPAQIRELIFAPGFSTSSTITDVSGRGVGLDVVRANVLRLRGTIEVESTPGRGTIFRLTLPVTLATTRVLLVQAGSHLYALPVEAVQSVQLIAPGDVFPLQGRPSFALDGAPVPLARLADLLELPTVPPAKNEGRDKPAQPCVILMQGNEKLGVWVDAVVDEQEIILKPLGALLHNVRNLAGATILDTGDVAMVLQSADLFKSAHHGGGTSIASGPMTPHAPAAPKTILLCEDSITTRTQEKRILEAAGYRVVVAVDGLDGWNKLAMGEFDALVSDVEMPNMDGLSLAARVRQNEKYRELPIILVTSLSTEADRKRGVEVGANAYITKGGFDQKALLDALKRLA